MLTPEVAAVDMSAAVPAASISAVEAAPMFSLSGPEAVVDVDVVLCPDDDDPDAPVFFFRLLLLLARLEAWWCSWW